MSAPRQFLVPKTLVASMGEQATLDGMEHFVHHKSAAGTWARKVLARENSRILDELLGDSTKLPRGVLADDAGDLEVVVSLINEDGQVWTHDGWQDQPLAASIATCELDDNDVAFIARALKEGAPGVVMHVGMPLAFLAAPVVKKTESVSIAELPEGAKVVAIVDSLDKNAVLEAIAIAPGPKVYRRHDGQWLEDPVWVGFLSSVKPPHMVKLDEALAASVTQQVDQATAGQEFVPFESNDVNMYRPLNASSYIAEMRQENIAVGLEHNLAIVAVAGKSLSPKDAASTEKLKQYWAYGEGAAKIRWFTPGAWRRCYKNLVKHLGPAMTPGYCTNLSQRLGGQGVATHVGSLVADGDWNPDLHPRGNDGKFINVLGWVNLIDMPGFRHGQRGSKRVQGTVSEIIPDPAKPGDPIIRVKLTDPRWNPAEFGETFDARSYQISERLPAKAGIDTDIHVPAPVVTPKPVKAMHADTGIIPPRAPLPGMVESVDSPNMLPLEPPPDWEAMGAEARLGWLKMTMESDYLSWRGEPTTFDFTGFDSGIAFNLANTYRDLTNWDPDTARRIDAPILSGTKDNLNGLTANAIAVAHPGTAHPGGIGPKIKQSAIVLKASWFKSMDKYLKEKAQMQGKAVPWSSSSMHGDPTITLIHEYAHQRQFRFLDVAMREVGAAWSPVVRDDGFGLVPDSSNWKATQDLRYAIPKATMTQYGQSKSSEGFAEAWATRMTGNSSPELNALLDAWGGYMSIPLALPVERFPSTKSWDDATPEERDAFWAQAGPVLALPGMREHYPETAAEFDAWFAEQMTSNDVGAQV